jgi:hypothetical protein
MNINRLILHNAEPHMGYGGGGELHGEVEELQVAIVIWLLL